METKCYLDRSIDIIAKYSSFIQPCGLLDGKMGMALFLYRYVNVFKKDEYKCYADELLSEIIEYVDDSERMDSWEEIIGIAIGINYLQKKKYLSADFQSFIEKADELVREKKVSTNVMVQYLLSKGINNDFLLNNIQKKKKIVENIIHISENDKSGISLRVLIDVSLFNLIYSQEICIRKYRQKVIHVLNDEYLINQTFQLLNINNLSLGRYFLGIAWLLLDIMYTHYDKD
jgi:hypothetical protein